MKYRTHVEDVGWPRKKSGKFISAKNKGAQLGVDFALQFAEVCNLANPVATVA